MANKSRLKPHEAAENVNSITEMAIEVIEEIEEDSEEEEIEIMGSETIEDPEEISVTDQKDASTVAKKVILPKTVQNVNIYFNFSKKTKRIQQQRQT